MAFKKSVNDRLKQAKKLSITLQGNEGKEKKTKAGRPFWQFFVDDCDGEDGVILFCWNAESNEKIMAVMEKDKRITLEYVDRFTFNVLDEVEESATKKAEDYFGGEETTHTRNVKSNAIIDLAKERGFTLAYAKDLVVAGKIKLGQMLETAESMTDFLVHGIQRDVEDSELGVKHGYPASPDVVESLLTDLRGFSTDDSGKPNALMAKRWMEARLQEYNQDELPWDIDAKDLKDEAEALDSAEIDYMVEKIKEYV
jgi:hypothetical protein